MPRRQSDNDLAKGAGEKTPLKVKGKFRRFPHPGFGAALVRFPRSARHSCIQCQHSARPRARATFRDTHCASSELNLRANCVSPSARSGAKSGA